MSKVHFNRNGNYYPPDWMKQQISKYSFKFFNDTCDYIDTKRKIEITEFKLGIHNPDSSITDVDMMDNPTYRDWGFYNLIYKGELYRKALIRLGKTNITKVLIEQDIKNTINQLSNIKV